MGQVLSTLWLQIGPVVARDVTVAAVVLGTALMVQFLVFSDRAYGAWLRVWLPVAAIAAATILGVVALVVRGVAMEKLQALELVMLVLMSLMYVMGVVMVKYVVMSGRGQTSRPQVQYRLRRW